MTGFSKFSFLRRVRIHDGECGAVARALHHKMEVLPLSAVDKKVLSTTKERKVMSKTTFFKRIALTAIAALGFGALSVVPSQAVVTSQSLTIDATADAISLGETASAVLSHSFVNLGSNQDSVTIVAYVSSSNASTAGKIAMRVTDSFTSLANDATTANSPIYFVPPIDVTDGTETSTSSVTGTGLLAADNRSDRLADSLTVGFIGSANRSIGTQISVDLYNPSAVGTYTIVFATLTSNAGATAVASTPTVTWTVTVTTPSVLANASSTATLRRDVATGTLNTTERQWGGTVEGTDSSVVTPAVSPASTTDTSAEATLIVLQKNSTGPSGANYAQESFTVTVTGEAFVSTSSSSRPSATGGVKSLVFATPSRNVPVAVYLWSTGTAGTASVTVTTASGQAIGGTKTLTFSGDVTTLTISRVVRQYLAAATAGTLGEVFRVSATDAGGRRVTGLGSGITLLSSNTAAVASGTACSEIAGDPSGSYSCSATGVVTSTSGMTGTVTARVQDPAATTTSFISSAAQTFTMGGAVHTAVLTLDKATYSPGEQMRITVTAKDSSGNIPYDAIAGMTLTANKAIGGTITMNAFYDGVSDSRVRSLPVRTYTATENLFAPAASGEFKITGTFTDAAGVSQLVSVTGTVSDDAITASVNAAADAALEAIDAANAATDAANLAAEAADAATVAAEEARDAADAATAAVEALATEVATLMAALKAQITTLANTVAKIAKKVKA